MSPQNLDESRWMSDKLSGDVLSGRKLPVVLRPIIIGCMIVALSVMLSFIAPMSESWVQWLLALAIPGYCLVFGWLLHGIWGNDTKVIELEKALRKGGQQFTLMGNKVLELQKKLAERTEANIRDKEMAQMVTKGIVEGLVQAQAPAPLPKVEKQRKKEKQLKERARDEHGHYIKEVKRGKA